MMFWIMTQSRLTCRSTAYDTQRQRREKKGGPNPGMAGSLDWPGLSSAEALWPAPEGTGLAGLAPGQVGLPVLPSAKPGPDHAGYPYAPCYERRRNKKRRMITTLRQQLPILQT